MPKRKRHSEIRQHKSDEPYDVGYFARKHNITPEQARELMRKLGRRDKLNEAASELFGSEWRPSAPISLFLRLRAHL